MNVFLRPLSRANVRAVCGLRLGDDQRHLVAPAACTVAEGQFEPGAVLRAIYLDDEPVGVLLVELESGTPYLVRFMVDLAHQRRGVGRQGRVAGQRAARCRLGCPRNQFCPDGPGCRRLLAPLWIRGHRSDPQP